MRIALTVPPSLVSPVTLGAALEAATRLAAAEVRTGRIPRLRDAIAAGVRWRREPPGQESFDPPSVVIPRKWGDCDDLAPWRAAELRVTGADPSARAIAIPSGPHTWHAVVQRGDGRREDPSRAAGMPHTVSGHATGQPAAVLSPVRPGLASIVIGEGRGVRIDVPARGARGRGLPIGFAVLAPWQAGRADAMRRAVIGAVRIGACSGLADSRTLRILRAVARCLIQSRELQEALSIEGVTDPRDQRAVAMAVRAGYGHEVGILPCLAAVGGVVAGVAAAAGAVTPVIKAIVDAVSATAKAVEKGVKPISELYAQVRAGIDQGTLPPEHAEATARELEQQGFSAEATTLRQQTAEALDAQRRRNAALASGGIPAVMAEDLMVLGRQRLASAASMPPADADRVRQETKRTVLASTWLMPPGPAAVWASLARAYGLDPDTARPPVGAKVARLADRRAVSPAPAAPGDDLPMPGIDALFARAGAFM